MGKEGVKTVKRRPLTLRQKKLRANLMKGGKVTAKKAMIDAGYSPNTAKAKAGETLAKVGFPELLDKMGITDERLSQVIEEGLRAKKDNSNIPDQPTRHKFLETSLKLKSKFPSEKTELSGNIIIRVHNAVKEIV